MNLVYWWLVKDAEDQEQVDRLDRQLWLPPKGADVVIPEESPWSAASEMAAFDAFEAQFKGATG